MDALSSALETLGAGRSLSMTITREAVSKMLEGEATEATIAAFLTALRIKGETADELEGSVRAVRERMTRWESGLFPESLLDTCGTGGDGANTVNISTGASIVVAACGIPVVKHGNRAASGNSGSSDVLSVLGVSTEPEADLLHRSLSELGIVFLFAPRFHAGLRHIAPVRRQLPFRTLFNLVGPLCNPACPSYQLIGTPLGRQADLMAEVLARLEHVRRAVVVTGSDGLDEVTLDGPTSIRVIERGRVERNILQPSDFGLVAQSAAALKVTGPVESAERLKRTFEGEKGPVRDYLLANSATAIWTTGRLSIRDGMEMAAAVIDSGAASRLLERWRQLTPCSAAAIS
jgi:anthranilate phosphoribosyltransferase